MSSPAIKQLTWILVCGAIICTRFEEKKKKSANCSLFFCHLGNLGPSYLLPSHYCTIVLISYASKPKILQGMLQQYRNWEFPDVPAGFRKGKRAKDQIANICWIIRKARESQKNIYFCFIDYAKAFDCVDHNKLKNSERNGNTRPPDLPPEKSVCRSRSTN